MTTEATEERAIAGRPTTLKAMLADVKVKSRFEEILGKKAPGFISSIISAYQGNKALQECDPGSIIGAAAIAASLNLPINPNIGQAAIVPYSGQGQFQIMWKGFVQMAHRTGKYKRINLARVYEGQLVNHNPFTGEVVLDAAKKKSDKIMGYYFFFELTNGYRHEAYWSAQRCVEHGWKFSKSFKNYGKGQWVDDPLIPRKNGKPTIEGFAGLLTDGSGADAMSAKTVVKNELNKWGPLSSEIEQAIVYDQAAITPEGEPSYIDSTAAAEPEKTYSMPETTEGAAEPENAEAAPAEKPNENLRTFFVESVAKTSLGKKDVDVIRTKAGDKFYTEKPEVGDAARAAMKANPPYQMAGEVFKVGDKFFLETAEAVKA